MAITQFKSFFFYFTGQTWMSRCLGLASIIVVQHCCVTCLTLFCIVDKPVQQWYLFQPYFWPSMHNDAHFLSELNAVMEETLWWMQTVWVRDDSESCSQSSSMRCITPCTPMYVVLPTLNSQCLYKLTFVILHNVALLWCHNCHTENPTVWRVAIEFLLSGIGSLVLIHE